MKGILGNAAAQNNGGIPQVASGMVWGWQEGRSSQGKPYHVHSPTKGELCASTWSVIGQLSDDCSQLWNQFKICIILCIQNLTFNDPLMPHNVLLLRCLLSLSLGVLDSGLNPSWRVFPLKSSIFQCSVCKKWHVTTSQGYWNQYNTTIASIFLMEEIVTANWPRLGVKLK